MHYMKSWSIEVGLSLRSRGNVFGDGDCVIGDARLCGRAFKMDLARWKAVFRENASFGYFRAINCTL
jgi:hypothetical protein